MYQVANIARYHLATQASSAYSERSFSKVGFICTRKRMMLTPAHVDTLFLLGLASRAGRIVRHWSPWIHSLGRFSQGYQLFLSE